MCKQVLSVRKYKIGYEVRRELIDGKPYGSDDIEMKSAYTVPDGLYLGSSVWAHRLYARGILPQLKDPDSTICSIGFCKKEQKWYGWSHRAIFGFGIDDMAKEGDCVTTSGWIEEYLLEHPEADRSVPIGFVAKTLVDCRRMAVAFADSVS